MRRARATAMILMWRDDESGVDEEDDVTDDGESEDVADDAE